jgi:ATP-dependent DNA ligase
MPQHGRWASGRLAYAGFDILWLDGRDLRDLPPFGRRQAVGESMDVLSVTTTL